MLQLKNISKDYVVGNNVVKALKNINIEFRKNEFVSILGPSGCGKTTLLNIIGGLDKSTEGVLLVNGQSTKEYKSADWDIYRNKKIGFVFQSYNLIPHQSVFRNVELSLTLAGMSKDQRRRRVKKALESVGLGDQLYKKPNQLSGGQMQRVAIARALVNNPEIILADEPTGALDSESGVQVMNLLREVAKDRLVIMVTHNEHLANEYSTRIVKLKDGEVVFDSNPYDSVKEEKSEEKTKGKKKKISMSLLTALSLSLNNLVSKKGRSFLTAFAGSIGIIGICMVLALSAGVNVYIESIEKDALSLYPLRIEEVNMDVNAVISLLDEKQVDRPDYPDTETIYTKKVLGNVLRNITKIISPNDLKSFKPYIDENFDDSWGYVKYGYGTTFNVYCNYVQ
ncbi:MAG: ABC transporter ATP-binding protein, partial [Christensenellales bacterium]